jgi:hypothetical protein
LGGFGAYLVGRHHSSRACAMLTRLAKRLADIGAPVHPQTLLESIDADVPLMRALEDFLTTDKLVLPPDRAERHAAARRQSRIDAVPEPLRPAVTGFAGYLLASRDRARRTGTHPRGHATLEARLTALRDFTQFLTTRRRKTDWSTVEVGDIEAFLHAHPSRRAFYLTGLRQFCRYALGRRLMLIDPTAGLNAPQTMAFRGPTLPADRQRELFQRWSTDPGVHPHEAFVGLAALLHGATTPTPASSPASANISGYIRALLIRAGQSLMLASWRASPCPRRARRPRRRSRPAPNVGTQMVRRYRGARWCRAQGRRG